jgi:glycosyltransferase involved in cell wall biosynthesis
MSALIVVPSLKIGGGVREAIRLTSEFQIDNHSASILSLWISQNEMETDVPIIYLSSWSTKIFRAIFELPILAIRFAKFISQISQRKKIVIFTHYTTLPLALFVPYRQRFFFVQGIEWNFVKNKLISYFLRHLIIKLYGSGRIISANSYLTEKLSHFGLGVTIEAPIWASPLFMVSNAPIQNIEFSMVLAKAIPKRLDLYMRFIHLARSLQLRIAVITPEDEISVLVSGLVNEIHLRPTLLQMRELYSRSICFIHLSENEGFGLPPLEAMAAGCIPICRDSGGVRAFMHNSPFINLLLPLSTPVEKILELGQDVIRDPNLNRRRMEARSHFQLGLKKSQLARKHLANSIMKLSGSND